MRFIPTKTHALMDYMLGLLLVLSPWLFHFANGGAAQWIPVIVGLMILLMSLFTDYEFALVKQVPVTVHLTIDVIAGLFLAASPWLFGFADLVFWPHLIFGLLEVGAGLFTSKKPSKVYDPIR